MAICYEAIDREASVDEREFGRLVKKYATEHKIRGVMQVMVAALDEMGIPNKEIARYLNVSAQSVSQARMKSKQRISWVDAEKTREERLAMNPCGKTQWISIIICGDSETVMMCENREMAVGDAKTKWRNLTNEEKEAAGAFVALVNVCLNEDESEYLDMKNPVDLFELQFERGREDAT